MGALADVTADLCDFAGRGPCTDAERRAALWLHDDLRARGHEAWVETVWVRPQWAWSLTLHATLGVVASLLAGAVPVAGLALAGLTLASYALELAGLGGGLLLLFHRRATQLVVVEPPDADAVALWISAPTDAPRRGLVLRDGWRRAGARLRPAPLAWVALALAAVTAAAVARVAGVEATWLGAVQLVPTLVLLLAAAAGFDIALSEPSPGAGEAAGVAVAMALHDELREDPPPGLSPGLVLAGAGDLRALGLRTWLRDQRPDPARTVLLDVGPCGGGEPAWSARHPQLVGAFGPVGRRLRGRRLGRLPVVGLRAVDSHGVPPRAHTEHDTPQAADEAAAEAVYREALEALERLELQPLDRSRANATNQS